MLIKSTLKISAEKGIISGVTNLSPDICRKLRDARRAAGISQSALAAEIGCRQSQLSMLEQGDGTKLNDSAIKAFAAKFDIPLEAEDGAGEKHSAGNGGTRKPGTAFCPNPLCPGHHEYHAGAERFLRPDRTSQDPVGGRFCALCGEVLETTCPHCGATVHDGGVCSFCGKPYIIVEE